MSTRNAARRAALPAIATSIALAAGVLGGLPAARAQDSSTILIGAMLSMTGGAGVVGADIQSGAQLAIDEINASGGLIGKKLAMTVQDTAGTPAQAVQLFGTYARNPNVAAILGPILAPELGAVTNLAAANKVVVFTPTSAGSVPGVPTLKFNEWTFRLNQAQPTVLGPLILEVMNRHKVSKQVTVLNFSDTSTYVDAGELWQKAAEGKGVAVQRIQFPAPTVDFSAIVTQINKSTELIAIGGLPGSAGPLARAIRQAGINAPIIGDSSMTTSSYFSVAQGAGKGTYSYSGYLMGAGTGTNEFVASYKKAHGSEPGALVALGYESIKLIAAAIKSQNSASRQAIRDGLGAMKGYRGITGNITYANSGDALRESIPLVQLGDTGQMVKISDIPLNK